MKNERGQTLAATLVVIAILAVLAVVMFKGSGAFSGKAASSRPDGKGTTVYGAAEYKAKDTVCQSNLQQDREGIKIYEMNNDDKPPENLSDIKFPKEFYECPVGHEPYVYDPQTGEVRCPHPGHEKY